MNLRRCIVRREQGELLAEECERGLILADIELKNRKNLGYEDFYLLDWSRDGALALLVRKKWLGDARRKSELVAVDLNSGETIFRTCEALFYRAMFSADAGKILAEAYGGLYIFDLVSGVCAARKRSGAIINNASLNVAQNKIYIPTDRKKLIVCDFNEAKFSEIAVQACACEAVKFICGGAATLVADGKDNLYRFDTLDIGGEPKWKLNLSRLGRNFIYGEAAEFDGRICLYTRYQDGGENALCEIEASRAELVSRAKFSGHAVGALAHGLILISDMRAINVKK